MDAYVPEQEAIRCVLMRGGTSRGLYFHEADLPPAGPRRDKLLLRLMGSPDVLQIDGIGGSRPITSKVAVISRSERPDADVDYTFGQVEIGRRSVDYAANCGNISAGVGPFAIDEGLTSATEGVTRVRIRNTNTGKLIVADVPVRSGKARVDGDFSIPGVPGTGAEIAMNWADTVGTSSGALLPTGRPVDQIVLEDGRSIEVTLCDAANPCIWVNAHDLGLGGGELADEINGSPRVMQALCEVRGKAAVLFGFCGDWRSADLASPAVPMIGMVAPPADYTTLNGAAARAGHMDLRVRLLFMNRLHESVAGTGSICLAAASRVPGSVVHSIARQTEGALLIGHPSGITATSVKVRPSNEPPFVRFETLGFSRTARRLMDSKAYYPRSLFDGGSEQANTPLTARSTAIPD